MFCQKCGNENPDGAAFCNACGTNIKVLISQPMPVNKELVLAEKEYERRKTEYETPLSFGWPVLIGAAGLFWMACISTLTYQLSFGDFGRDGVPQMVLLAIAVIWILYLLNSRNLAHRRMKDTERALKKIQIELMERKEKI